MKDEREKRNRREVLHGLVNAPSIEAEESILGILGPSPNCPREERGAVGRGTEPSLFPDLQRILFTHLSLPV